MRQGCKQTEASEVLLPIWRLTAATGFASMTAFYEKVENVKADVAAVLV